MISGAEEEANTPGTDVSAMTERLLVFITLQFFKTQPPQTLCGQRSRLSSFKF